VVRPVALGYIQCCCVLQLVSFPGKISVAYEDFRLALYTLYRKTLHLTFCHNFEKRRPIFEILSLTDYQGNSM